MKPPRTKRRLAALKRPAAGVSIAFLAVASLGAPATAAERDERREITQVLQEVPADRGILQDEAPSRKSGRLHIPKDPSVGIALTGTSGSVLHVGLPFDESAREGIEIARSSLAYDNQNGSVTVPTGKDDGSVQITTIINSSDAPSEYEYEISIDGLSQLVLNDDGSVAFVGEDGSYLGGTPAPWAIDANGDEVSTVYEVANSTLTQRVDHTSGRSAYPIVADPWLGIDLYTSPYVTFPSGGYKINVSPTTWGQSNSGAGIWWAHPDEVVSKLGGSSWRWTNSIQEQFYCHIAGLPFSLPEYNLESWRPVMNWAAQAPYKCNYPEGYFSG